ncbi:MAG: hypothetical protein HWQ38_36055 [Nostoc sp. NMS7]|uniref:hypothetical protein n=1 Tax=Nostoc sp. NMS7 TaxID=2815391 RepID=UPI0025D6A6D5|nr:hypothetical protein [Nostoc sp. NMS7]MBN3951598.1 hypothetical protein [Nostoc sp. NMS7]
MKFNIKVNKPILLSITSTTFLMLGYFGSQYFSKNIMFTLAATVGGGGAIAYVIQKPSEQKAPANEPEPTMPPMKTQRRVKKS